MLRLAILFDESYIVVRGRQKEILRGVHSQVNRYPERTCTEFYEERETALHQMTANSVDSH